MNGIHVRSGFFYLRGLKVIFILNRVLGKSESIFETFEGAPKGQDRGKGGNGLCNSRCKLFDFLAIKTFCQELVHAHCFGLT